MRGSRREECRGVEFRRSTLSPTVPLLSVRLLSAVIARRKEGGRKGRTAERASCKLRQMDTYVYVYCCCALSALRSTRVRSWWKEERGTDCPTPTRIYHIHILRGKIHQGPPSPPSTHPNILASMTDRAETVGCPAESRPQHPSSLRWHRLASPTSLRPRRHHHPLERHHPLHPLRSRHCRREHHGWCGRRMSCAFFWQRC